MSLLFLKSCLISDKDDLISLFTVIFILFKISTNKSYSSPFKYDFVKAKGSLFSPNNRFTSLCFLIVSIHLLSISCFSLIVIAESDFLRIEFNK